MRAVLCTEFGPPDVLRVTEVPTPTPKDDEVLVRVFATSVGYGDLLARNFRNVRGRDFNMPLPLLFLSRIFLGFRKPKVTILGSEFSGEVASIGKRVSRFKVGDPVFGYLGQRMGGYAEYVRMPEAGALAMKPANLTHAQAALVPYGAVMASGLLRRARVQPGQRVLVNGASGGIGSAAVQLAKALGAEVTGVCGAARLPYVKAFGADHVIDYASEDFTQNGESYDLILDVLGRSAFARCRKSLTPTGIYFPVSFKTKALLQMLWRKVAGGQKVICALVIEKPQDLVSVRDLIEAGKYQSIVDRSYPLEQAAEAHRYAESGAQTGRIGITVAQQ